MAAPTMAEVVRFAGGWLFDQVSAGWDVLVLTADLADARPLQILGAHAMHLEDALAAPAQGRRPQAVAVAAELYESDIRVRERLRAALADGLENVRIWDDGCIADDVADFAMPYRPSNAARAFKAQALVAAAVTADVDVKGMEVFHTVGALR
ncbi:hypothetical protein LO772_06130 [Yinghuangia sp. ASG 101]|uniref:hypothetical protein n=1 Tax=Yinghuangia sp. ASG 101 TaxID=2896848 RepID=UPI001E5B5F37|nr:hypothetical protein [Yinghuangia sp. ASG 101]UGQ13191.1 hypothetical protein LO772_06130 [Yinghuangia sp. ASG 101]